MTENKEPTATKFMTEDTNNNYPADPAWDYYIPWHSLLHIKAIIDFGLGRIKDEEVSTFAADIELREILEPGSKVFTELVLSLPEEEEDDEQVS